MRKLVWALSAAAALMAPLMSPSAADATTYLASRAVGAGMLDLSITTDGALGVLTDADILDWDVTVTQGADSFTLQGPGGANNSEHLLFGTALTATLTDLLFNFSSGPGNAFIIQAPFIGSSETFWCVDTGACVGHNSSQEQIAATTFANRTATPYAGDIIIASVGADTSGGVPEPASWALMLGGFGLAGAAFRRRRAQLA